MCGCANAWIANTYPTPQPSIRKTIASDITLHARTFVVEHTTQAHHALCASGPWTRRHPSGLDLADGGVTPGHALGSKDDVRDGSHRVVARAGRSSQGGCYRCIYIDVIRDVMRSRRRARRSSGARGASARAVRMAGSRDARADGNDGDEAMRAVVVRWWIVDRVVGWILLVRGARARGAGGARARAGKGRRARERVRGAETLKTREAREAGGSRARMLSSETSERGVEWWNSVMCACARVLTGFCVCLYRCVVFRRSRARAKARLGRRSRRRRRGGD